MLEKIFKSTGDLLDKKLKNGTVMVVIISCIITMTGFINNSVNANLTANILVSKKQAISSSYIILNWKKYKIILEEVKKKINTNY